MNFNPDKCFVLRIGKSNQRRSYSLKVSAQAKILPKTIHDTLPQFDCFPSEM